MKITYCLLRAGNYLDKCVEGNFIPRGKKVVVGKPPHIPPAFKYAVWFNNRWKFTNEEPKQIKIIKVKQHFSGSELIKFLGAATYGAIYAGANIGDMNALYFVNIWKEMNIEGKRIYVNHPEFIDALNHFVSMTYITQAELERIIDGIIS